MDTVNGLNNFYINFYTQFDKKINVWYAHSDLSVLNGTGETEDEAIHAHIGFLNNKVKSEPYEDLISKNPNIIVKRFVLIQTKK